MTKSKIALAQDYENTLAPITVTVTYNDDSVLVEGFRNIRVARDFARDEAGEATVKEVVINSSGDKFLVKGDYVTFCDKNA